MSSSDLPAKQTISIFAKLRKLNPGYAVMKPNCPLVEVTIFGQPVIVAIVVPASDL